MNAQHHTNRWLGYPDDARLLIINADDFGLCHAVTEAIFETLLHGIVQSTTLMVPCQWATHAMNLLKHHPDQAFGVHLTVICDTISYPYGPITPKERVRSLIDETGHFYHFDRMAEFLAQVDLHELEIEWRAQIEAVLAAGLEPTHLDWHCLRFNGRTDLLDLMARLAQDYGLALRVIGQPVIERLQRQGLPTIDYDFLDSFGIETSVKAAHFVQLLRELPEGLSEWAVHPGFDNAELRTIQPTGAAIRQADFDFLISQTAREIVDEEGIILVDYRALQPFWAGA